MQTHKAGLVSTLLWLDGKIAFSFSYLHRKTTNKVECKNKLLHKDDSEKTKGFYHHSNVIRIESEGERQK